MVFPMTFLLTDHVKAGRKLALPFRNALAEKIPLMDMIAFML